jgi:predicted nicotinamide N-methyase
VDGQAPITPPAGFELELCDREEIVAGRRYALRAMVDFEAAVDRIAAAVRGPEDAAWFEELCPMFGVIWPAARALAGLVAERVRPGESVIELGCGLALPSLAAAAAGARVLATDGHPWAERLLEHNARANGLEVPFARLDWRDPGAVGRFDRVIASDVLYGQHMPELLAAVLPRLLAPGGVAWITDPGRPPLTRFLAEAAARGLAVAWDVRDDVFLVQLRPEGEPDPRPAHSAVT